MRRTRAGGDARLHDRWSIGVGGHLNPGDGDLLGGLRREWDEEVVAGFVPDFRLVGLLNDDTTAVGQVHLGAVYVADAAGRPVDDPRDREASGGFATAARPSRPSPTTSRRGAASPSTSSSCADRGPAPRDAIIPAGGRTQPSGRHIVASSRACRSPWAPGSGCVGVRRGRQAGDPAADDRASSTRAWPSTSTTASPGRSATAAAAVIIKLNTPGGALTSTNDIVGTMLEAKVPVIVWVAPAGGFAASAGTFITLAANIALMAPGTPSAPPRRSAARARTSRDDRREDQERRDRQDHRDRPGPPPQRRLGRLDRRSRPFVAGHRGGRARRGRRDRADARGRAGVGERQDGRGRGRAGHARPRRRDRRPKST